MVKDRYIIITSEGDNFEVNEHHLSILSLEIIRSNLITAEKNKNYEKCALLRDEIKKRENRGN